MTARASDVIVLTADLAVTHAEAWRLITVEACIQAWWGEHVALDARLGGQFVETWRDGDRLVTTSGTIQSFTPPHGFTLSWRDEDWPADTEVSFRLSGTDGAIQLTVTHSGWSALGAERGVQLAEAHRRGWSMHLSNLTRYAADTSR